MQPCLRGFFQGKGPQKHMQDQYEIKKRAERAWLDSFFKLYDGYPEGKIIASESPDFILSGSRKRTIGIELTSIVNSPGNGRHLAKEAIDESIQKKNAKLKLYMKKRINSYWLIIILNDHGDTMIHQNTASWQFESGFQKIFIFDPSRQQILQIK